MSSRRVKEDYRKWRSIYVFTSRFKSHTGSRDDVLRDWQLTAAIFGADPAKSWSNQYYTPRTFSIPVPIYPPSIGAHPEGIESGFSNSLG
jgi:hypothetical protein